MQPIPTGMMRAADIEIAAQAWDNATIGQRSVILYYIEANQRLDFSGIEVWSRLQRSSFDQLTGAIQAGVYAFVYIMRPMFRKPELALVASNGGKAA
jgi:hypothetical protein